MANAQSCLRDVTGIVLAGSQNGSADQGNMKHFKSCSICLLSIVFSMQLTTLGAAQTASTGQSQDSKSKCADLPASERFDCIHALVPKKSQDSGNSEAAAPDASSARDEKGAQFHYKVARAALKDKNFDVATRELLIAARLAPANALVQYNLAVVKSESGNPTEALTYLKRAIELGTLPDEQAKDAERRLVDLTYASERFSWLIGSWRADFTSRIALDSAYGYASCQYEGPGEFKMNVSKADDQSDALIGEILYTAESQKFLDGPTSRCRKKYGAEDQLGSASYKIFLVTIESGVYKGWATIEANRLSLLGNIGFVYPGDGQRQDLPEHLSFKVRRDQDRLQIGNNDCAGRCLPDPLERDN